METFQAVIHAGADAVYLGGGRFGARAYANNFTEEELLLANVAHLSNKGNLYDAFRGRVMFPIVDTRGAVIGFGGRVLDDSQPKYLNTAKTPVFDKGSNLFSLNFAKDSSSTIMILAEG